jgi:hypothetical protein
LNRRSATADARASSTAAYIQVPSSFDVSSGVDDVGD